MSRNYDGVFPLRGIDEPVRSEATAWLDVIRWRMAHGIVISGDDAIAAEDAITRDVACQLELKASPTAREP